MPGFRPATRERYSRLLFQEGIVEQFGNRPLDEFGAVEYLALQARVLERGVDPRPHLALLRTVLREAYALEAIRQMPRLPKLPPKQRKLPSAPPLDVVRAAFNASDGWLRLAIGLAFFAGLRSGEVRALRAGDVDFGAGLLAVRKAYSADSVLAPKSGHERSVPLAKPLRDVLEDAARGKKATNRLVTDENGRTPSRQALYKAFVALQKRIGIDSTWAFHDLRHGFASNLARLGANVESISSMLGHADLAMTSRYLHASSGDMRQAIGLLEGNWRETTPGASC